MMLRARRRAIATAWMAIAMAASSRANAQTVTVPWRDALRGWCGRSPTTECARIAGLDPDSDDARRQDEVFLAADRGAREISALALMSASQPLLSQRVRNAAPVTDAASASRYLDELVAVYVALLPPGARSIARSWRGASFVSDVEAAQLTHAWQTRVHDANTPAAAMREQIVRAAMLVARAVGGSNITIDAALDDMAALGTSAIANGAAGEDVIRALVMTVETMPQRPPPPDPWNDGPPDHPSRRMVLIAMEAVRAQIARCVGVQDATLLVRVTFQGSDGHAAQANVVGPFEGTMVGACARTVALNAHVPPFARDEISVNYPFSVFGAHPDRQPPPPAVPPGPGQTRREPVRAVAVAPVPPPASTPAPPAPVVVREPTPPPVATPTPTPAVDAGAMNIVAGDIGLRAVFEVLEPALMACAPGARGQVTVEATINAEGLADHVSAQGPRLAVEARDCIEQAVMGATFPGAPGEPTRTVRHVLRFRRR